MPDTRFKPGQSGNPNGRPRKGKTMTDILDTYLKKREATDKNDPNRVITRKERLAQELFQLAAEGDVNALRYIFDRVDGKPEVTKNIRGLDAPTVIEIVREDDESNVPPEDS